MYAAIVSEGKEITGVKAEMQAAFTAAVGNGYFTIDGGTSVVVARLSCPSSCR